MVVFAKALFFLVIFTLHRDTSSILACEEPDSENASDSEEKADVCCGARPINTTSSICCLGLVVDRSRRQCCYNGRTVSLSKKCLCDPSIEWKRTQLERLINLTADLDELRDECIKAVANFTELLDTADEDRNFIVKKLENVEIFHMDSELFTVLIKHLSDFVNTTMNEGGVDARTTNTSAKCELKVWNNYVGRIEDWRNETNANLTDLLQPDMAQADMAQADIAQADITKKTTNFFNSIHEFFQPTLPVFSRRIEDGRYIDIAGIPIPVGKSIITPAGKARRP